MNRDALIRYGIIKSQIKKLEEELELIQPAVEASIKEAIPNPGENYVSLPELETVGKFGLVKAKPKWEYSGVVQDLTSDLEDMKKTEQANGKAKNLNEGKYDVRFMINKE